MDNADMVINDVYGRYAFDIGKAKKIAKEPEDQKSVKVAKDFEALFIKRVLSEMKNTVDESGFDEDAAGSQIRSLFYSYLAEDVANKGGFGLWKDVQALMNNGEAGEGGAVNNNKNVSDNIANTEILDESV